MRARESRPVEDEAAPEALAGATGESTGVVVSLHLSEDGAPTWPMPSLDSVLHRAAAFALAQLEDETATSTELRDRVLHMQRSAVKDHNLTYSLGGGERYPVPSSLSEATVVQVILARHDVVGVDLTDGQDEDAVLLAVYQHDGPNEGLYDGSQAAIFSLVADLAPGLSTRQIESVMQRLRRVAPRRKVTREPHLVPVANGVYDWARKTLEPFTPEWVFLSKVAVEYDPAAVSPVLDTEHGDTWEVEEWMRTLSDDEEVVELLWQMIAAACRSAHPWGRTFWLISEKGNNGKGTLTRLIRNLLGARACASVPMAGFGEKFALAKLITAQANIVDENAVGAYAQSVSKYKAAITGDVLDVDRKYKDDVAFQWRGVDIQCFNDQVPRVKDKSPSFTRRLLLIPFEKSFEGVERKYIKEDFLGREEVLRYVLRRVLEMPFTELSEPQACKAAKAEWVRGNNPVAGFWDEHRAHFAWDLLPFPFLYDLYKAWSAKTNPSGQADGQPAFTRALRLVVEKDPDWNDNGGKTVRSAGRMSAAEPLIATYELKGWYNPGYTMPKSGSPDLDKLCRPALAQTYRGLVRTTPRPVAVPSAAGEDGTKEASVNT